MHTVLSDELSDESRRGLGGVGSLVSRVRTRRATGPAGVTRGALAVCLTAATLLVTAPGAWASATVSTNGGYASYTTSTNRFTVADTNCDNNDVYGQWRFTNSTSAAAPSNPSQLRNSKGCNNTESVILSPGGYSRIVFRHCTDDAFGDTCSSWVNTAA